MNQIKELLSYLTNQLKFWFIIKEWETGLQLRNGKVKRVLKPGIYFKIPLLDFVYSQPIRTQDIIVSQINFTTKDKQSVTASAAVFYKINNISKYYNGYAEPNSIIGNIISNEMNRYFLTHDFTAFNLQDFESKILKILKVIDDKGFEFNDFKLTTFSNARTYRIIKDNLYSQNKNELDNQLY